MFQQISYATRTLFNALINGNRGTQAPYTNEDASESAEARAMLGHGGPAILAEAPATALRICVPPQGGDFVHAVAMSRMLPAFSLESASGGWVAIPYAFDPPPMIPAIILPQAQWSTMVGDTELTGLTSQPSPVGAIYGLSGLPEPGLAYPGVIGNVDDVTSTGAM